MTRPPHDRFKAAVCRAKDPLTRQQAREVVKRMMRKYSQPIRPYRCPVCSAWHIGNPDFKVPSR